MHHRSFLFIKGHLSFTWVNSIHARKAWMWACMYIRGWYSQCLWACSPYVCVRLPVESSITTLHRECSSRKWKKEKRIPRSKRWGRLKERVRGKGESQVGNWWCNCWLLVSSYLGFSGLLSGLARFPISVSLLEWAEPGNPYAFFYFLLVCLTCLLSLFLSFHCALIPWTVFLSSSVFLSLSSDRRHAESSGLERAAGEGESAASRGSKVSLQQDRVGWGGKHA